VEPQLSSIVVVMIYIALILAAGVLYLRRARIDRPPVGVFNGRDILVVGVVLMVLPPAYLRLPTVVLAAVFALLSTAIIYFSLVPLLGGARAGATAVALVVLDVIVAEFGRDTRPWLFNEVNNLALAVAVVGVGNLWVQSGIRALHVALLACGLALYDGVATLALPLMSAFLDRISSVPLTPLLAWGHGESQVGIGLGDLLLVLVWTLVAEKAFSRRAGLTAATLGLSSVLALFLMFWLDFVSRPLPAMVLLGPVIALHYRLLIRKTKQERTIADYFATLEPIGEPGSSAGGVEVDLQAALLKAGPNEPAGGGLDRYLALRGGEVVATGVSVAEAIQAAREVCPGTVPLLMRSASAEGPRDEGRG
jgi:hypothetical protein